MAEVTCSRCGATRAGLERAPLPGSVGDRVLAQTCAACWTEWKAMQVRFINEYRLSPLDPGHYDYLVEQMKGFLNLREA